MFNKSPFNSAIDLLTFTNDNDFNKISPHHINWGDYFRKKMTHAYLPVNEMLIQEKMRL